MAVQEVTARVKTTMLVLQTTATTETTTTDAVAGAEEVEAARTTAMPVEKETETEIGTETGIVKGIGIESVIGTGIVADAIETAADAIEVEIAHATEIETAIATGAVDIEMKMTGATDPIAEEEEDRGVDRESVEVPHVEPAMKRGGRKSTTPTRRLQTRLWSGVSPSISTNMR